MQQKRMTSEERVQRERALQHIERLQKLAEKAQAELDRRKQERASA